MMEVTRVRGRAGIRTRRSGSTICALDGCLLEMFPKCMNVMLWGPSGYGTHLPNGGLNVKLSILTPWVPAGCREAYFLLDCGVWSVDCAQNRGKESSGLGCMVSPGDSSPGRTGSVHCSHSPKVGAVSCGQPLSTQVS